MAVTVNFSPAAVDLIGIRAGDQNRMQVILTSGGLPWDLTGYEVAAQARLTADHEEALNAEVFMTDPTNGVVAVEWPGEAVRALLGLLTQWRGVWDLQITPTGGEPYTVAAGAFLAELDVTREDV